MKILAPNNIASQQIRLTDINIFPTFKCNLDCSYCIHKNKDNKYNKYGIMNEKLSYENFYNLTQFLRFNRHPDQDLNIQINGGEPMLDWDHFKNFTLILRDMENTELTVISNLTGDYTKEQFDFISSTYDKIVISLDGDEMVHDLGRGDGSYSKTINNIMTLAARNPLGKVEINRTITEDNVEYFIDSKNFLDGLGIMNTYNIDFFSPKRDEKNFVQTLLKEFGKLALITRNLDFIPFLSDDDQYCLDKHLSMSVLPTGEMTHCAIEYDKEAVFYDLNKFPDMEIDKEKFNNIKTFGFYDEECETCQAKSFCKTGCYAAFKESRQVFCSIMAGIGMLREELIEYNRSNK